MLILTTLHSGIVVRTTVYVNPFFCVPILRVLSIFQVPKSVSILLPRQLHDNLRVVKNIRDLSGNVLEFTVRFCVLLLQELFSNCVD